MRISVSPPSIGTVAIRFISAEQRQSGNSVEPASSRRSNFDMTPHRRLKAYVLWAQVASVNSIGFSPLPTAPVDDPDTKLGQDCYIVRDANGHALAYVYFEAEPRRCPLLSRRIVSGHRRP